jgi:hypothetical protein
MSSLARAIRIWLLSASACALAACSFNDRLTHCSDKSECGPGLDCYEGFCVTVKDSTTSPVQMPGAKDAGTTPRAGTGGSTKDASDPITNPPPAAGAAADAGADAGTDAATDAGKDAAPVTQPDAATVCQGTAVQDCVVVPMSPSTPGQCNKGKQHCEKGVFGACVAEPLPAPETCNGLDDDCNGIVDDGTDTICYPDGQAGCTLSADKASATCKGLCAIGQRLCRAGKLEACSGAIVPIAEACTSTGTAADENCDGAIDEMCACTGSQSTSCYTGPSGTADIGTCKAGTQTCSNGMFGACTGSVVPQPESCDNQGADNDCNALVDDLPNLGAVCIVASNMGICRAGTLQCQTGNPALTCVTIAPLAAELCNGLDDNCDGKVDETFMLDTDPMHCGSCTKACGAGETCCGGQCSNPIVDNNNCGGCGTTHMCGGAGGAGVCCNSKCTDFASDVANCGTCGHACASGESCCAGKCLNEKTDINNCGACGKICSTGAQPACCNATCADLQSNANCGTCGNSCGLLAVTCECAVMNGAPTCVAPVAGVCI